VLGVLHTALLLPELPILALRVCLEQAPETDAVSTEDRESIASMINGLPEWARRYIHDIETYEPSGATSAAALAARYAAGVAHGAEVERRSQAGAQAMPARGEEKRPPPPETLVGALQDRIHPTSGKLIRAKKILAALEKKR